MCYKIRMFFIPMPVFYTHTSKCMSVKKQKEKQGKQEQLIISESCKK